MMQHICFAVCGILALCSNSWAKGVALKPEVLPLGPDYTVTKIQRQAHVAGDSQASSSHRAALRNASFQIEEDRVASSASNVSKAASPTTLGRITNTDLVWLGTKSRVFMKTFETQHTGLAILWWLTIFVFGVPIGCLLLCATMSYVQQDEEPIVTGKVVDEEQPVTKSPVPVSTLSPAERLLKSGSEPQASPQFGSASSADATSASPRLSPAALSPQSFSRAVWTPTVIPPPLCSNVIPLQTMASFWVSVRSLRQLYRHSPIEITGPFDYPMLRARLSRGLGSSRLEIASEPFFNELLGCVGPLDYPGNLNPNALVHGPRRELYGPFGRLEAGFAVGHYSRVDHVFTVVPKKASDGLVIEVNSSSPGGQQLAWARMVDGRTRYQIAVHPGVDTTLMIICILAAFVASQNLIDEVGTTIS